MAALNDFEELIREKVEQQKWTHKQISTYLKSNYPTCKGFSVRSIQRFCSDKEIHRTSRLSDSHLERAVSSATDMVGPVYGRKFMTGLLAAHGIKASESRVGKALKQSNPSYHQRRMKSTAKLLNPIPYKAEYYGHKLHIDQNEKLVMYGVTHVCAIDGYSGRIVGFVTMPVKNNFEIYEHLFRPSILEDGLWDQVRVDHGKEFYLSLFVQEYLEQFRTNRNRAPHLQSTSRQNHPVERIWVEVNSRVNYPVKACLVNMEERGEIDMESQLQKFCVSWFSIRVCCVGTRMVVQAWNEHSIPGHTRGCSKRIPNQAMLANSCVAQMNSALVPTSDQAVELYQAAGGQITLFSPFGEDPLVSKSILKQQRDKTFIQRYPTFDNFFYRLVNGDDTLFREGLLFFIHITYVMT